LTGKLDSKIKDPEAEQDGTQENQILLKAWYFLKVMCDVFHVFPLAKCLPGLLCRQFLTEFF
jgi:hypothetical protein